MSGQVSQMHLIRALIQKDLTLFFRNRFFALVTVLGLVAWSAIYFLMPRTVDEVLEIGIVAPGLPPAALEALAEEEEGLIIRDVGSEAALKEAMLDGDYHVGAVLPADFLERIVAGARTPVQLYFTSDLPQDLHEAYVILFREWAFLLAGKPLKIEATEEVLGIDMSGEQIPPRKRMLPLLAVLVLMVETMGLSSLISGEFVTGTAHALLITPMRLLDLYVGKGITGVGMAFVQATLLITITGGLSKQPVLILAALLLGSVLVTGIGFLIASAGRDLMSVLGWGVLAVLLLSIPALGVMFPGLISSWIKVIPSYYLVDTVHRVMNFGAGWSDVWTNLLILLGFSLAFFSLGIVTMRRKLR